MKKLTGTAPRQQATADLMRAGGYTISRDGSVLLARKNNDFQLIQIDGTCQRALRAKR